MWRKRTAVAFVLSGCLHGALLLLLLRLEEVPSPTGGPGQAVELELITREPEGARTPTTDRTAPRPSRRHASPARRETGEAASPFPRSPSLPLPPDEPGRAPPAGATSRPSRDADAPRKLDLSLSPGAVPSPWEGADPRGQLRNGRESAPDAAALAREEAGEVRRRVDTLIADDLAALRVADGAVDTYFADLGRAMEKHAARPPAFVDGNGLRAIVHSYKQGAANYGARGNPGASPRTGRSAADGLASLDQVGADSPGAPKLGFDEYEQLRGFVDDLGKGLVAVVEVRQAGDGRLLEARLLEPSGNPEFDAHVLRSVPAAVLTLQPPPERGAGIHSGGMRSRWAFKGKVSYARRLNDGVDLVDDSWYLALVTALGAVRFDEVTGEVFVPDLRKPQYLCTARLLQVY